MIAYEIQLRYVIRDKIRDNIQSEVKFSPRQNSVQDKIWKIDRKRFLLEKYFVIKKKFSEFFLD